MKCVRPLRNINTYHEHEVNKEFIDLQSGNKIIDAKISFEDHYQTYSIP